MVQLGVNRGLRKGDGGAASPPYGSGPLQTDTPTVFNSPVVDSFLRTTLVENFARKVGVLGDIGQAAEGTRMIANPDFHLVGTGASTDDCIFSTTVGGLELQTDASGSQQVIVAPHLDTDQTGWAKFLWGTENQVIWEAVVRTGSSIADIILWAGLKLTNDQLITADNTQAYFRFDAGVANWELVYTANADGDVEDDSGVVVAVNTNYYFKIAIDSERKPHFYINNVEVGIGTALANDIDLIPYVGVEGNAKTFILVKEKISRLIFE